MIGGPGSPAGQLSHLCIEGGFRDVEKIKELASISDVITTEIEHVNTVALSELESAGKVVHPSPKTIALIQDKYQQKLLMQSVNVPLPEFMDTPDLQSATEAGLRFGYPFMLKNKKLAYDGRGNAVVKTAEDVRIQFEKLGGSDIYAEKFVPFVKELAVMVVRTSISVLEYPVVETVQRDNICHIVTAPAQISQTAMRAALTVARDAVSNLEGNGVFGVEMFLLNDDTVVLNEIAPR